MKLFQPKEKHRHNDNRDNLEQNLNLIACCSHQRRFLSLLARISYPRISLVLLLCYYCTRSPSVGAAGGDHFPLGMTEWRAENKRGRKPLRIVSPPLILSYSRDTSFPMIFVWDSSPGECCRTPPRSPHCAHAAPRFCIVLKLAVLPRGDQLGIRKPTAIPKDMSLCGLDVLQGVSRGVRSLFPEGLGKYTEILGVLLDSGKIPIGSHRLDLHFIPSHLHSGDGKGRRNFRCVKYLSSYAPRTNEASRRLIVLR
jgi:hypothetical protein